MNTHKTLTLIFAALLFLIGAAQSQHVESGGRYLTAWQSGLDSVYIYIVRNAAGQIDIDSTLTVKGDVTPTKLTPPTGLIIEPNASTGMAAGETDSLLLRIYPMVYDYADGEYAVVLDNYRYASFGQVGELVATRTALDWDDGAEYYISLDDISTTNPFAECGGVCVQVIQRNSTAGYGLYTIQPVWKLDNK